MLLLDVLVVLFILVGAFLVRAVMAAAELSTKQQHVVTSLAGNSHESLYTAAATVPINPTSTAGIYDQSRKQHSNIFSKTTTNDGEEHEKDKDKDNNNIFDHRSSSSSKVAKNTQEPQQQLETETTTTPILTFTIRIGFVQESTDSSRASKEPPPNEVDRLALFCQINRYIQQRLRDKTEDTAISSTLQKLSWTYSAENASGSSSWQVQFVVHSTFGYGETITPWTLVKVLELPRDDIRYLVRNYVWPLNDTIFAQTRTLFFGGTLGFPTQPPPSGRAFEMQELSLDSCPPAPPIPPPVPTTAPTEMDPFGLQTEVPREEDDEETTNRDGSNPLFSAPERDQDEDPDHHPSFSSFNDTSSSSRNPQQLTITVPFWVANNQGITDPSIIQSKWLEPTFPILVERVTALVAETTSHHQCLPVVGSDDDDNNQNNNCNSSAMTTPQVVPNTTRIVEVLPMPCPIPTVMPSTVNWICHQVVGSYDLQQANPNLLVIPMETDPAIYTHGIKGAIQSGIYETMIGKLIMSRDDHNNQLQEPLAIRIGNDIQALRYSWWYNNSDDDVAATSVSFNNNDQDDNRTIIIIQWVGTCVSIIFFVLLLGMVAVGLYCRHQVHTLQQKRDNTLWEMQALDLLSLSGEGEQPQVVELQPG